MVDIAFNGRAFIICYFFPGIFQGKESSLHEIWSADTGFYVVGQKHKYKSADDFCQVHSKLYPSTFKTVPYFTLSSFKTVPKYIQDCTLFHLNFSRDVTWKQCFFHVWVSCISSDLDPCEQGCSEDMLAMQPCKSSCSYVMSIRKFGWKGC